MKWPNGFLEGICGSAGGVCLAVWFGFWVPYFVLFVLFPYFDRFEYSVGCGSLLFVVCVNHEALAVYCVLGIPLSS
jgi:hypothetical protein